MIADSLKPFVTSAFTAFALVAGAFGPRALDADSDGAAKAEKAAIAAATPKTIKTYAKLQRDPKSASGWAAIVTVENPSDEEVGVVADLAVSEMVGGEMSRAGPMPTVRFEQKIDVKVAAHGQAQVAVAVPKGKLVLRSGKMARSASASAYVQEIRHADGTVVKAEPPRYGARRMPILRRELAVDDEIVAAPQANVANAAPVAVAGPQAVADAPAAPQAVKPLAAKE